MTAATSVAQSEGYVAKETLATVGLVATELAQEFSIESLSAPAVKEAQSQIQTVALQMDGIRTQVSQVLHTCLCTAAVGAFAPFISPLWMLIADYHFLGRYLLDQRSITRTRPTDSSAPRRSRGTGTDVQADRCIGGKCRESQKRSLLYLNLTTIYKEQTMTLTIFSVEPLLDHG